MAVAETLDASLAVGDVLLASLKAGKVTVPERLGAIEALRCNSTDLAAAPALREMR